MPSLQEVIPARSSQWQSSAFLWQAGMPHGK